MTEFSTVANLEIQVDQGSLRSARSTIEDRMGSVSPSVRPDGGQRSGSMLGAGGSGGVGDIGSPANLLAAQLEKLGDIEEAIEKLAVTEARSGGGGAGGGILQALGLRSVLGGGGGLGLAAAGTAGIAGLFGLNSMIGEDSNTSVVGKGLASGGGGLPTSTGSIGVNLGASIGKGLMDHFNVQEKIDSIQWPELPELPDLSLPDPSDVADLVLNLPAQSVVSSLTLGLPGASAVSNLVLGLPEQAELPKIAFDAPDWLENLLGGGGGGQGGVDADTGGLTQRGGNRARERAQGGGAEINIPLDFTVDGLSRRDLERELDQMKRDVIDEVAKQIGF